MFIGKATIWTVSDSLVQSLKDLGYYVCGCVGGKSEHECLFIDNGEAHKLFDEESGIHGMEMKSGISDSVDCGCDEEIFLEIARMTDSNETIKKE